MTDTAGVHQLIEPALACHALKHRIERRARLNAPGHWDYCFVCSLGFQMAKESGMTDLDATAFVNELRRRQ